MRFVECTIRARNTLPPAPKPMSVPRVWSPTPSGDQP
jgi:hypothetical protein